MSPLKPTPEELSVNLVKIDRWKQLGFNTEGLEELLKEDFEKFKERKLKILAGQISADIDDKYQEEASSGGEEKSREMIDEALLLAGKKDKKAVRKVAIISFDRTKKITKDRVKDYSDPPDPDRSTSHPPKETISEELPLEEILSGAPEGSVRDENEETITVTKTVSLAEPDEPIIIGRVPAAVKDSDDDPGSEISQIHETPGDVDSKEELPPNVVLVGEPSGTGPGSEKIVAGVILLDNKKEPEEDVRYNYYDISNKDRGEDSTGSERDRSKKARRKEDEHRRRDTLIALGVMVILVIAGVVILDPDLLKWFPSNNPPGISKPELIITEPLNSSEYDSGELIVFEATVKHPEEKISSIRWDFGDGDSSSSERTSHFYSTKVTRNFRATFSVKVSSGEVYDESVTVRITPTVVTLPEKREGLRGTYDLESTMVFNNPEGIELFSDENSDVTITKVDIEGTGTLEMEIELPDNEIEDGFSLGHSVYTREVNIDQELDGNATVKYSTITGEITRNMRLFGNVDVNNRNYVDLTTGESIKGELSSSMELYSEFDEDTPFSFVDEIINYRDLSEPSLNLDITEIRENRTFRLGDAEPGGFGNLHYMWSIDAIDNVGGKTALKVDIKLHEELLSTYGITDHSILLWIANDKALPVKFYAYLLQEEDGTTTTMTITGNIQMKSYVGGVKKIFDETCASGFNDTSHHASRKDQTDDELEGEFNEMKYVPAAGDENSAFQGFTIDDAVRFVEEDAAFKNYISAHPNAFGMDCRCNRTDGKMLWNITFGEKGSDAGMNFLVYDNGQVISKTVDGMDVNTYSFDLGEVVSFDGSIRIFKEHPVVEERFFTEGELHLEENTIGAGTTLSTLSMEALYTGSINNLDFGFFLSSEKSTGYGTSSKMSVIDGQTGQILYIMEHTETAPSIDQSTFF